MKLHLNMLVLLLTFAAAFVGHLQECAPIAAEITDTNADAISDTDRNSNREAILNNCLSMGQTFSLRPQRVSSSNGYNPVSHFGNGFAASDRQRYNEKCLIKSGKERMETSPFQSSTSKAYYVFALRRILC